MAKYIALSGMCATHKKPMGFQFQLLEDGIYMSVGSFSSSGGGSNDDAVNVSGRFVQGSSFRCKYCGNGAVYICGRCHTPFCIEDGATKVVCPKCGVTVNITWVDDINDVDVSSSSTSGQ